MKFKKTFSNKKQELIMKGIIFAFAACLLASSCAKSQNDKSIRLYANASGAYAEGRFTDTVNMLEQENNFVPALVLRAKAEYFSGDFVKAEKSCRRIIQIHPSAYEAKLYLARILREKDDLKGALKITEVLLADDPQDIRALRLASQLSLDAGKTDDAAAFLDRASEYSAESAMVLLDRARLRWVAGKKQEALEDLSRAKAMLPWDTSILRSITNLEKTIIEAMQ